MDRESIGLLSAILFSGVLTTAIVEAQLVEAQLAEDRSCEVVISAGVCSAPQGQVRRDWPLPEGCSCSPWDCWLSGREASSAVDLGEVSPGEHHWRILLDEDSCRSISEMQGYLARTADYVPCLATAGSLTTESGRIILRGSYAGRSSPELREIPPDVALRVVDLEAQRVIDLEAMWERLGDARLRATEVLP